MIFIVIFLLFFIFEGVCLYKIYNKSNLRNSWIAFIPFIGQLKIFHLANKSSFIWVMLKFVQIVAALFANPLIFYIFVIVELVLLFKIYGTIMENFSMDKFLGYVLLFFIPIIFFILLAFRDYNFNGYLD